MAFTIENLPAIRSQLTNGKGRVWHYTTESGDTAADVVVTGFFAAWKNHGVLAGDRMEVCVSDDGTVTSHAIEINNDGTIDLKNATAIAVATDSN